MMWVWKRNSKNWSSLPLLQEELHRISGQELNLSRFTEIPVPAYPLPHPFDKEIPKYEDKSDARYSIFDALTYLNIPEAKKAEYGLVKVTHKGKEKVLCLICAVDPQSRELMNTIMKQNVLCLDDKKTKGRHLYATRHHLKRLAEWFGLDSQTFIRDIPVPNCTEGCVRLRGRSDNSCRHTLQKQPRATEGGGKLRHRRGSTISAQSYNQVTPSASTGQLAANVSFLHPSAMVIGPPDPNEQLAYTQHWLSGRGRISSTFADEMNAIVASRGPNPSSDSEMEIDELADDD